MNASYKEWCEKKGYDIGQLFEPPKGAQPVSERLTLLCYLFLVPIPTPKTKSI